MQEISEPEYKNLTSLEELEKMKGLPLATSGNAASISSRIRFPNAVAPLAFYFFPVFRGQAIESTELAGRSFSLGTSICKIRSRWACQYVSTYCYMLHVSVSQNLEGTQSGIAASRTECNSLGDMIIRRTRTMVESLMTVSSPLSLPLGCHACHRPRACEQESLVESLGASPWAKRKKESCRASRHV